MKTRILFVLMPLLAAMTANASAIDKDLAAVNAEFGTQIQKQELGKILDHCGRLKLDKEFDIGTKAEPHIVYLNPLTYMAHKASVDTLWALLKAFEREMAKHEPATKREVRFNFYEMLVRAMVKGNRFVVLHELISRDQSSTKIFAVTLTRKLILALIEEENTFVLLRFHDESAVQSRNERSLGTKYPDLYKCQPDMAKRFNSSDMRLFVVRDLIENLIKSRGTLNDQIAKDMLKFYMSFYSDWKTLPVVRQIWAGPHAFDVTKNLVDETHQKFPEHFEYVMEVLKVLRAEVVVETVVPSVIEDLPESPIKQPSPMKKSTSFTNSPPLVRHKPKRDATPTRSILKKRDSATESSSRDISVVTDSAQKKAKPVVAELRSCSDIAFVILGNHPDEFIAQVVTGTENPAFCSVNGSRSPTLAFLLEKGRFALLQKLAATKLDLGLNEHWQGQLTGREILFDLLLKQRSIQNIAAFLSDPNLHGDERAKASLLLRLAKAHFAKTLTYEEFEQLVMTEGVFANAGCVEEIEGGAGVVAALLRKMGARPELLATCLSIPWFASQGTASTIARKELMKAATAGDGENFTFWANSGLIDLNGKEYDFAE